MKQKPNLPKGAHDLAITKFTIRSGKVTFIFTPIFHDSEFVMRTFKIGSNDLALFIKTMTGKSLRFVDENICESILGKMIVGELDLARNPRYVDLIRVIKVWDSLPDQPYNNTAKPVIEIESASKDTRTKGIRNARQARPNHP